MDDELWALIEPLLPPSKPRRDKNPERQPVSNRAAPTGILLVLKTGLPWRDLPAEMRRGSGVTCWRRLSESGRRILGERGEFAPCNEPGGELFAIE